FIDDERRHPEIVAQPIQRPLFLTGLARTGTTILHELCALDPAGRAPQAWEVTMPSPAPELATYATDPRTAQMTDRLDAMLVAMPQLRKMHPWGATLPADCLTFLALHCVCSPFVAAYTVPEYSRWMGTAEHKGRYRAHKRALQQLQWLGPQ